jgi:ferric-dicitrate binding protein FerR (iron transport regulator)
MDRATELIERYLDDIATAAERAELAALVAADPSVADVLARAARIDARLRQLGASGREPLAPAPAPVRAALRPAVPLWRSWKVGAAAAVLMLVAGLAVAVLLYTTHQSESAFRMVSGQVDRIALETPLAVAGDQPAVIRLAGGAQADLAPGSRFVLHGRAAGRGPHMALLIGSGTFSVPRDSAALTVDTPGGGTVTGQGAAFAVRVVAGANADGRPEWQVTVTVALGVVEARQGPESIVLSSVDPKTFHAERPPDLVGLVEGVGDVKQRQVINGVERILAETRVSLAIRAGHAAAPGSRLTVRLTDGTRSTGVARPVPGNVVRVWIAPGTGDLADYVEIVPP